MAEKLCHQFDLNEVACESNDEEEIIGETSDQRIENDCLDPQTKRKRHTQQQIEQMEAFFNDCPIPDGKQRKALSLELGLEPVQVRIWFQNKRTLVKAQCEHQENAQLQAENKRLKAENLSRKATLGNVACISCGDPMVTRERCVEDHPLLSENARLREEIDRISAIVATYIGKPATNLDKNAFSASP